MENEKITRTVMFDRDLMNDNEVYSAILAVNDWYKNFWTYNVCTIKKLLEIEHLPKVKLVIKKYDNAEDATLRILVYKTKKCHVNEMMLTNTSHMIQISITHDTSRSGWNNGELSFSAKVFARTCEEVVCEVEDILTDILLFYAKNLNEYFDTVEKKQMFSECKVNYIKDKGLNSYIGNIVDAEYVSFASFCRVNKKIDYKKYLDLWEDFVKSIKNNELKTGIITYNSTNVQKMLVDHPKGMQISMRRIRKLIEQLDPGDYVLIRTEHKPNDKRTRREIMSRFGMKKWKTGRIKIEEFKRVYTWMRLKPFVSIYVFRWGE